MPIHKMIALYVISLFIFLIVDMIWLGVIAKGLYRKHLGDLLRPKPNWIAASVFYLLFVAGILVFVVLPAISRQSFSHALLFGCLFGLITYATYDLTNLATIKNWPIIITAVDLVWGSLLCTIVSAGGYWVYFKLFKP